MRLIDADAIETKAIMWNGEIEHVVFRIDNAPTVDAVPVEFIKAEIRKTRGFYNSNLRFLLDVWEQEKAEWKEK